MTDKQTALKDVRKRQTAAVRRAFAGNRPTLIGRDEVNAILREAGLPEAQDETEVIISSMTAMGTHPQRCRPSRPL
jgi:Ca2+-binding EF-hand superfamily protein